MARLWTAWRGAGGLMVALVIAVLAMGPGVDAFFCGGEDEPHAASTVASAAHADGQDHDHAAGEVCIHGHCHHPASGAAALELVAVPSAVPAPRHDLNLGAVRVTDRQFALDRVPRTAAV